VDPTGCGDAYRAGLIHGLLHGLGLAEHRAYASLMGAIKIESRGTQNTALRAPNSTRGWRRPSRRLASQGRAHLG